MASGTPDYYQTVRQVYGAAKIAIAGVSAVANSSLLILDVSGKGVIYGGQITVGGLDVQYNDRVTLKIDGIEITIASFKSLSDYDIDKENMQAAYLIMYDNELNIYGVALSKGITFDSRMQLYYTEAHGRTPGVGTSIIYALLE